MSTIPSTLILNVDDHAAGRYATTRVLKNAGFAVIEAGTGREALSALAVQRPNLVLLDVNLPDISGLEICRHIKANPETAGILVAQISATAVQMTDRVAGLDVGADAYISQPVEPAELIATINSLLRLQRAERLVEAAARDWQATFAAIRDAVAVLDAGGRVTRCNPALARLAGRTEAAIQGQPLQEVLHGQMALPSGMLEQVLRTGQAVELDLAAGEKWFHCTFSPVLDEARQPRAIVCTMADVTARQRAETIQAVLADVGRVLSSELDAASRLASVAQAVVPRLADWAVLYVAADDGTIQHATARYGHSAQSAAVEAALRQRLAQGRVSPIVARVLKTGESFLAPEVTPEILAVTAANAEHLEQLRAADLKSAMVVPFTARGQTLGAMMLMLAGSGRQYGAWELGLAEEVARRAALALDNARLYEEAGLARADLEARVETRTSQLLAMNRSLQIEIAEHRRTEAALEHSREQLRQFSARLQAAREEERTHIARDIHDELGGAVTALKMDLARLRKGLNRDDVTQAKFQELMTTLDVMAQTVRRIAMNLRPALLDDFGLEAAIEWQLAEFQKRSGIECHLELPATPVKLDPDRATALFRLLQEALTNVARHAQASQVHSKLEVLGSALRLEVRDNGRGIRPEELEGAKSLGLVGMRERVLLLSGELQINSATNGGTQVVVVVPIQPAIAPDGAAGSESGRSDRPRGKA